MCGNIFRRKDMSIKMIVTDLDGTLLRTEKTISDYTASVFFRCRDKGIKTVFATARPIRTVNSLNLNIEKDATIYHNGAVITIADKIHRHIGIDPETRKRLIHDAATKFTDLRITVEIDDVLYANFDTKSVWADDTGVLTDFSDLPEIPADKIIFCTAENHIISEINKLLANDLYSVISENQILMVMKNKAQKLFAVKEIAEHYGISISDIVAFGDDYNDVDMLRECGVGVAVGNAINEAKVVADFISDTNDNDGVAKWLETNVLHKTES
jgi:Cof subfamily protein (haloacid dehalogenase superfamily)